MSMVPSTERGRRTRAGILAAAEIVFAEIGYTDASIVKITEQAGVAQGTFYLYFEGKKDVFDELVEDLNRRVRHAMTEASMGAASRMEAERRGFAAFFTFTAEHPALYRIIRQAEFVSPGALRLHYTRIVEGYIAGLTAARDAGEIGELDPAVAAWVLMGIGEMVGMRWVLWGADGAAAGADADPTASGTGAVPAHVFDEVMRLISRALDVREPQAAIPGSGRRSES